MSLAKRNAQAESRVVDSRLVGEVSYIDWRDLCKENDDSCFYCGDRNPDNPRLWLTVDHIYPLSWGGCHDISNVRPVCKSCNSAKGSNIWIPDPVLGWTVGVGKVLYEQQADEMLERFYKSQEEKKDKFRNLRRLLDSL